jgi:hypothetical protein
VRRELELLARMSNLPQSNRPPSRAIHGGGAMVLLTLLLTMGIIACSQWLRKNPPPPVSVSPPVVEVPADPDAAMRVYRESIIPLLDDFDQRNVAAADRALATLHARIARHRAGVDHFARDVRSWGTRFGVIGRYTGDLWRKVRRRDDGSHVAVYVNEKFRQQVISEDQLQQDVAAVLRQFDDDLAANRNRLYTRMSLPLATIRCKTPLVGANYDQFREQTQRQSGMLAKSLAGDTVVAGIAEFSASWAATDVSQALASRVVTQILTRVGTSLAVEGIEAGGATAGGAAAGGGAGSVGGPAGTIIGLGVGLIIGAAVDWWLSDQFEAHVQQQCNQFLSLLDRRLCEGSAKGPGLRQSLTQTVQLTGQAQRESVRRAMQEIKTQ